MAAPQNDFHIVETPKYAPLAQDKIVELYETLKAELANEHEDGELFKDDEIVRNTRSALASPIFFPNLFGPRQNNNRRFGTRNGPLYFFNEI